MPHGSRNHRTLIMGRNGAVGTNHQLRHVGKLEGPCSVQAIRIAANGVCMVGSDPRRDGWAGAY